MCLLFTYIVSAEVGHEISFQNAESNLMGIIEGLFYCSFKLNTLLLFLLSLHMFCSLCVKMVEAGNVMVAALVISSEFGYLTQSRGRI